MASTIAFVLLVHVAALLLLTSNECLKAQPTGEEDNEFNQCLKAARMAYSTCTDVYERRWSSRRVSVNLSNLLRCLEHADRQQAKCTQMKIAAAASAKPKPVWAAQIRLVHCLSITYCNSLNNSAYIIIIIHFDITIIAFCYFIHMYDRPKQRLYELNNYEICHYRLLLWAWTRTHHGLLQTVILKLARA